MSFWYWLWSFFEPKPAPIPVPVPTNALAAINQARAKSGLAALIEDPRLVQTADGWANVCMHAGTLIHGMAAARIMAAVGEVAVGECLAYGQPSAAAVVQAWLDDPPHRAIVMGDYTHVGAGSTNGYWVADFARET